MHIELHKGEKLIKKGHANNYEHHILHTGKLYLTNQRLYFATHPLNFRKFDINMPLEEVTGIELKNNFKFFSHGFYVVMHSGIKHHFSVWQRRKWKQALAKFMASQE